MTMAHPIEILGAEAITGSPAMFPAATGIPGGVVLTYSTVPDGWPGGEVHAVRSTDGGSTWSSPVPVVVPTGEETAILAATGLARLRDGTLLLPVNGITWPAGSGTENRQARLRLTRSADDGATWEDSRVVDVDFFWPAVYGDILEFDDGELLWPVWGRRVASERWRSVVLSSRDAGRSWSVKGTIAFDPDARLTGDYVETGNGAQTGEEDTNAVSFRPHDPTDGFSETSVVELADGRLFAVLRQQGVDGDQSLLFFGSFSDDRGETWSPYRSLGFSGMSPTLHRIGDGRLLLASRRSAPEGTGIAPAVDVRVASADAATWSEPLALREPLGGMLESEYQCGYPTIVPSADPAVVDVYFYSYAGGRYIGRNRVRVSAP